MSRHSHVLVALFICIFFAVSYLTPSSSSQSSLRSVSLNGTTASVDVPNHSTLNITGSITVEAWIKYNSIDGNNHVIVSRIDRNTSGSGGGYELSVNTAGKLRMDLFQSHNSYTTVIGTTAMSTGVWHHVAGVFNGSQMRVYVDGVQDGSFNTTNAPGSGTSLLRIGKAAHTPGVAPLFLPSFAFAGLIDEVRVSAAALYTSNFTPGTVAGSNVRGLWKFDGQTANDTSGNNNHGSLQNGATYSTDVPAIANNAPSVSLVHPLNNTSFTAGSNIVMDATASDSDGSVAKVDFYQGTTLLGTDTTAPYTFVWTNVAAGSYSLTAKATDDANATTTSSASAISVVAPGGTHSISLNGTTASVDVPNHSTLNITGSITVEAWIKYNSIDGNNHVIVSRIDRNTSGSGGGYELSVNTAGKLRMDLFQSHNSYTTVIGTTVMSTGVWHHVAGVFNGSQMRVYVDGVQDGSFNTTNAPGTGTSLLRIGKAAHTSGVAPLFLPSFAFAGLIDEVRVSAAALYTSNFTPGTVAGSNVRGLWKFDGQTANDTSGNGNNGTLQNGAAYSTDVPTIGGGSQPPLPSANGPYSGQAGQPVQFSSSGSIDPGGSIVSYYWNFGDGTFATTANPARTYAGPGLYTATLTVTDNSGLLASATALVTVSSGSIARLDPLNQTGGGGENPLSRNFNWTLPLVNLPGRAGLDLSLSLSYNSLVWTRTGSYIAFDEDRGFPGPGFRLGFPVLQPPYYNPETTRNSFLLIGSDGSRTELRQVNSSVVYEAANSSYMLLDTSTMVLRTADGTQLKYELKGSEYQCTQIKDRNGNYITVNYTAFGRIDTVIDTLGRSIKFNYDVNGWLTSITQIWNQGPSQVTYNWASFEYTNTPLNLAFTGLTVSGASSGSSIKTLSKVTLADSSHYDFSYTNWGQVWKVSSFATDNHLMNYRAYKLPGSGLLATSPQTECPRFTEHRDWAKNWNRDVSGVEQEAITTYAEPASETSPLLGGGTLTGVRVQVTAPDLTSTKIYFIDPAGTASDWQRGLPALMNTYDSNGVLQRQVKTTWTQDNTAASYIVNPRVLETDTYDPAGNRARLQITYQQLTFPANGTSCHLPRDVYEYAADATTILRSTRTDYHTGTVYSNRRILGLVTEKRVYAGNVNAGGTLMSRVGFFYDNENEWTSIQGTDEPTQHDNLDYDENFFIGRGNLSSVRRYDVTPQSSQFTTTRSKFNTAGAVVSISDALNHTTQVSYADSFSDGNNSRGTLAYPTTETDPANYTTSTKYNFDFGAVTYQQTPKPGTAANEAGPQQTFSYDPIGRLERTTNLVNSAYTRYIYGPNYMRTFTTVNTVADEAHYIQVFDGAGRMIGKARNHPGSEGGFSGQITFYDAMGRPVKESTPTETIINIPDPVAPMHPYAWPAEGDDSVWNFAEQTFDWKGRLLRTTHPDGKHRDVAYSGCGCAGGEVMTVTDEGTVHIGTEKRRQHKIYSDPFGRQVKIEVLNWDGGSVYATTVKAYNARDQVESTTEYAGAAGSGTFQTTTMTYDGYGRLQTQRAPQQSADIVWTYNSDDTINSITDARQASQTFAYNNRQLITSISYGVPSGSTISLPAQVTFTYDGAGNRLSMNDGLGTKTYQYDLLSRLTQEARGLSVGTFAINYSYNLTNQLISLTDPFGSSFSYTRDTQGRLKAVTGSPFAGTTNYVLDIGYRAWDAPKSVAYSGRSSTVSFNTRLQPTEFRLTTNGTGASIIRENYSYFADGRLNTVTDLDDSGGTNPPATLRFLSRAYWYDQVGRFGGAQGTGIASWPAVPYIQSYGYDVFGNITARSGAYYVYSQSPPTPIDTATYSNNRRTNWSYNANGQVTSTPSTSTDVPRTMTYDAGGRMITTVQTGPSGTTTYSATYDGDGQLVYESSNAPGSTNSSYILRSTVLRGEVLTRLDQSGNQKVTHVPAEGLLFATQIPGASGQIISTLFRDPLGVTETGWAVYDPLGNYVPYRANGSPQPPTGSYNSGSMSGLSSSLSNANNYALGCVLDGLPANCNLVGQMIARDQTKELGVLGVALTPQVIRLMQSFTGVAWEVYLPAQPTQPNAQPSTPQGSPGGYGYTWSMGAVEIWTEFLIAPGMQRTFEQNSQDPPQQPNNPQGPLVFGGTIGQPATADPCFGVKASDLDFSREHFTERHILNNDPKWSTKSKYAFYNGIGARLPREPDPAKRLELARAHVIQLDKWTFDQGGRYQYSPASNIVIVYGFPKASSPAVSVEFFVGIMGSGQPHAGELTNVNTLILAPDCKTVITSHPGLPGGFYHFGGTAPYYREQ